jgi:hypothetical protein
VLARGAGAVGITLTTAIVAVPVLAAGDNRADDKRACAIASEQGETQRDEGKYRAARKSFLTCARDVCPKLIAQSCTKWLSDLNESAPTVVLAAKDEHGGDLVQVRVTLDGEPLAVELDGKPIEVDAGSHVLRFERDGTKPVEQKIVLRAGEKARVVTITLWPTEPSVSSAPPPPARNTLPAGGEPNPPSEPFASPRHLVAGSIAVGAIAAAGVGAFFLVRSNHDGNVAASLRAGRPLDSCTNVTSADCQSLSHTVDSQHRESTMATAFFIGAGALATAAVFTWFLGPRPGTGSAPATGWVAPAPGGATLHFAASLP